MLIENNVPVPTTSSGPAPVHGESRRAIVSKMEVGDSFVVEESQGLNVHSVWSVAASASGAKVTVRKQGPSSYRVWRVA